MQSLDRRYKYTVRYTHPFYLYIKYKRSGIFYVRFKDGSTYSTKETDIHKAYTKAQFMLDNKEKGKVLNPLDVQNLLRNYFKENSEWVKYDTIHGSKYTDRILQQNNFACCLIADLLKGTDDFKLLTKARLHRLQEQLLSTGRTGKTVNNYLSILHKVIKQLIDKDYLQTDPFIGLRNCAHEKKRRLCFPIDSFNGFYGKVENLDAYSLVSYCAIITGARRAELSGLKLSDIGETKHGIKTLRIRGTKSEYSDRTIPLSEKGVLAITRMITEKTTTPYVLNWTTEEIGHRIGYSAEKIKEEGICFHSFRKMYKTILTSANLNTSLVEMLMGHSTDNQSSNNVERIYFVQDRAEMTEVYKKVIKAFDFLNASFI